jgi:hypothetical protein
MGNRGNHSTEVAEHPEAAHSSGGQANEAREASLNPEITGERIVRWPSAISASIGACSCRTRAEKAQMVALNARDDFVSNCPAKSLHSRHLRRDPDRRGGLDPQSGRIANLLCFCAAGPVHGDDRGSPARGNHRGECVTGFLSAGPVDFIESPRNCKLSLNPGMS